MSNQDAIVRAKVRPTDIISSLSSAPEFLVLVLIAPMVFIICLQLIVLPVRLLGALPIPAHIPITVGILVMVGVPGGMLMLLLRTLAREIIVSSDGCYLKTIWGGLNIQKDEISIFRSISEKEARYSLLGVSVKKFSLATKEAVIVEIRNGKDYLISIVGREEFLEKIKHAWGEEFVKEGT